MNDYTIASVQRALRILKLFLPDNQPMTLKQIADESDLNKSTALRMTTTLLNEKFLSYNEETRKYQLGYCALALGISKLASIDLIEVSRPILEELANRSNMFIHLAILEDEKVVVISKIFPKARMQNTTQLMSQIGGILPMHCTGIGLLFLSQHDDKYCREFLSRQPLDSYTTTTQTEIPQIMERIQNIRDLQYVINNGEHDEGIVSACVPIYDYTNGMVAGISLGAVREAFERAGETHVLQMVQEAAAEISRLLGSGRRRF